MAEGGPSIPDAGSGKPPLQVGEEYRLHTHFLTRPSDYLWYVAVSRYFAMRWDDDYEGWVVLHYPTRRALPRVLPRDSFDVGAAIAKELERICRNPSGQICPPDGAEWDREDGTGVEQYVLDMIERPLEEFVSYRAWRDALEGGDRVK